MKSKREKILDTIESELDSISEINGKVFRSRKNPMPESSKLGIIIEPGACIADNSIHGVIDWTFSVSILVHIKGDVPEKVADPYINLIHSALINNSTINGLAMDMQVESFNFEFFDSASSIGVFPLNYKIIFRTIQTDLTR